MTTYQILSEDHVVEALTRYLREPPFKLDFDELEINFIDFEKSKYFAGDGIYNVDFGEPKYKFELTLTGGSGNES
jgi:hypothetical protein